MTPDDIRLVRSHLAALSGQEVPFSAAFYDRLFAISPDLRPLFPGDMAEQSRKLMMVLHYAVTNLDRPETLGPAVTALGARHAAYGVHPNQFPPVGAALLDTLENWLGDAFDPRARQVWTAVYGALAGLMQGGLQTAAGATPTRLRAAG
jgi:hemoglobin-like flavoprotein